MTDKMKLLSCLGVLGFVLLVGGIWFLLGSNQQIKELEITVTPATGSYLLNSQNVPSEILLKNIRVSIGTADSQYNPIFTNPSHPIEPGETILLVTVIVQNTHPEYKIIGISATGYDASGKQVAWTLDDSLHAMFWSTLDYGETGEFTLHLNFSKNTKLIRIFGHNYEYPVP